MTDIIKQTEDWLKTEPNATEVIVIRRRDNNFAVKVEYGDRTTVPCVDPDLTTALSGAIGKASRLPSSARVAREKAVAKPVSKPIARMPG